MTYEVTLGDTVRTIRVDRAEGGWLVAIDGADGRFVDGRAIGATLQLLVEDRSYDAGLVRTEDGWDVDLRGTHHGCTVLDPRRKALRLSAGVATGTVKTSMPGRIVTVHVSVGDEVAAGDPILIVEAMKMENEMRAPIDGRVVEVLVGDGDAVDAGARLLRIE